MSDTMKPRFDLSVVPPRMRRRPVDHRGFPVPWFVHQDAAGAYDFRVVRRYGIETALRQRTCWLCGEPLGRMMCFTIGPMCVVNRVSSEPPSHRECADFAVRACPFLTKPKMRRNANDLPGEGYRSAPGLPAERNPGGAVIYTTRDFRMLRARRGNAGSLIQMGHPSATDWFTLGRPATEAEARNMLEEGAAILMQTASEHDGPEGVKMLARMIEAARCLLPS